MTRQTAEKYTQFLNELVNLEKGGGATMITEVTAKYGITSGFFTFLVKRGYFEKVPKKRAYVPAAIKNLLPLDNEKVQTLINEFNRYKKTQKGAESSVIDAPVRYSSGSAGLANYTTRALLDELKNRGYTGVLTIKKEIRF